MIPVTKDKGPVKSEEEPTTAGSMLRLRRPNNKSKYEQVQHLTPKQLKEELQRLIKDVKGSEVVVDEDAFYRCTLSYCLIEKSRDSQQKRSIISEKQSCFTNPHNDQETNFTIKSSYEEASSLEVVTDNKHSVTIGGKLSGESGGKAGIWAKYKVEWRDKRSKTESQTKGKELTLSGCVQPSHRVIVREITYDLQNRAHTKLDIIVSRSMKVKFTYTGRRFFKRGSVKMKTLLKSPSSEMRAIDCSSSGVVTIHMESDCVYNSVTHNLEYYSERLPDDYSESIISSYQRESHSTHMRPILRSNHWDSNPHKQQSSFLDLQSHTPQDRTVI